MDRILIVEDEKSISDIIARGLEELGYETATAHDGIEGWRALQRHGYDMVIMDIIMPGMDGLELCKWLRREQGYTTPVLMLTALNTTEDIVNGLSAGADDYLSKPFKFAELVARVQAMLRRSKAQQEVGILTCCDLELDCRSRVAKRGDAVFELTQKEFRLLEYLMTHPNKILSRHTLLREVWNKSFDTNTNIVDVYVNYLRNKVDQDVDVRLIHTVVGRGYLFGEE